MLGLPKSTEFNRRIPKQKFYENLTVSPAVKRIFVEQIRVIWWRNKIAPATMNLAAGEAVTEIEVFEVCLSAPQLDEAVLRQIDKEIPYHILFLLGYEGKYQAWTAYKEAAGSGTNAFKVGTYYHTDWLEEAALPLKLDGLNTDQVYENFVRQIAGEALSGAGETLKESVERDRRRQELQKQVAALQVKVRREKQLNKQVQLSRIEKIKEKIGGIIMTEKEAIDIYEKAHFLHDQNDIRKDIDIIRCVLSNIPIDMHQVRTQIDTVNRKHPENIILFNLIFPPQGNRVSVGSASDDNLISDLTWKLDYLQAKQKGKAFDEFCKTMRNIVQERQDGGLK